MNISIDPQPIAVIGATGQQGGAALRALRDRGARVRAIVRDQSKADFSDPGIEVATADLDDAAALGRALDGVAGLFAMTTMTGPDGTDGEIRQGRQVADAARAAGVPRVLYSSVGAAERHTGVPHFESKWQVEEYLREIGVPTMVLRPTFFMDNFSGGFVPALEDGTVVLRAPLAASVPLQMIAVADIGTAAATALLDPDAVPDGAVEIAGDELTPEQIASAFGAAISLPARFEAQPVDVLPTEDMKAMFTWLAESPAYAADFSATRALVGEPTDFATFAAGHPAEADR